MKPAILYARFSPRPTSQRDKVKRGETTARELDEMTISQQLDQCREFAHRKGYKVVGEHHDEQLSGADAERPGLWEAVAAVPRGGVLVCYDCKRLAREVYLSELLQRQADRQEWSIEFVEGVNGDSPQERLVRSILSAMGEYERQVIRIRTKLGMLRNQRNGRRMSAKTPFGTAIDPEDVSRLVPHDDELRAKARILALHAAGQGMREICRTLTDEGFRPRGKAWEHKTVARIIRRETAS